MTQTRVPGWYPDATQFGFQRYWDGCQWTRDTRLGDGVDLTSDPLIAPMSLRWLLAWAMLALILALAGVLVLAVATGNAQVLGLALVALSPLLWILAAAQSVLVTRMPRADAASRLFAARSRRIVAVAALTPPVIFALGWIPFH